MDGRAGVGMERYWEVVAQPLIKSLSHSYLPWTKIALIEENSSAHQRFVSCNLWPFLQLLNTKLNPTNRTIFWQINRWKSLLTGRKSRRRTGWWCFSRHWSDRVEEGLRWRPCSMDHNARLQQQTDKFSLLNISRWKRNWKLITFKNVCNRRQRESTPTGARPPTNSKLNYQSRIKTKEQTSLTTWKVNEALECHLQKLSKHSIPRSPEKQQLSSTRLLSGYRLYKNYATWKTEKQENNAYLKRK